MAEMEYFCCFNSYLKKTRNLSDSELGRLFRALMTYNATGEKAQLNGREETAFDFISEDIDTAKEKYAARCEQNKTNRAKQPITTVDERQPSSTTVDVRHQTKNKKQNNNPLTPLQGESDGVPKPKAFVPPTPEEVNAYCQERKNGIDGTEFVDFYQSKGWLIGKSKMKDWKAAVRTWEKSRKAQSQPEPERRWI